VWALFKLLGVENLEDAIPITNCISLADTYWVQEVGQNKKWAQVSPYRNPLNEIISEFSFTGRIMGKNITSSPDFSTDGTFPKCWVCKNDRLYLYKAGSEEFGNSDNESYSEVYAWQLEKYLGVNALEYVPGRYKGKDISICECMTDENIGLKSFREVTGKIEADYPDLLKYVKDSMSPNDYKQVIDMLLIDVLICNTDRHYGNIGVLINNNTQEVIGISKIYDNNFGCIPLYTERETVEFYVSDIISKDGSKFVDLYKLIMSSYTKSVLIKAKDFKLKSFGNPKADLRLNFINKMLQIQIEKCLECHRHYDITNEFD
jgi:hypothetical protein